MSRDGLTRYYNTEYGTQFGVDEELGFFEQQSIMKAIGAVRGKDILDVGCGTGSVSAFLVDENRVHGLECGEEAVERARQRGLRATAHDIEQRFPFADKSMDIVICRETFEHLLLPLNTLKEIHRVLKDEGVLFATVPNHFSIEKRVRILLGKGMVGSCCFFPRSYRAWNYPHLRFFTHEDFVDFLREGGFRVVHDHSPLLPPLTRYVLWEIRERLKQFIPNLVVAGFQFSARKAAEDTQTASL